MLISSIAQAVEQSVRQQAILFNLEKVCFENFIEKNFWWNVRLLSDTSVIMFAPLNVKLIMNGTWTWWVIHDGVWVDGGEPAPDWSIQNLAWRLQNDSTLWKREKIKKMKNAWKYKRYIKFKNYSFKLELTIRILVLWDCRVFAVKYHWKVTMIDMIKLISGVGYLLWLITYES